MTDLAGLIERLEGASGPDREIDAALMVALGGARRVDEFNFYGPNEEHWSFGDHEDENGAWSGPLPRLTASLDAAVALAKSHGFHINSTPMFHIEGERVDYVSHALRPRWNDWRPDDEWFDRGEGRHANQVLSALIATLRALQASTGEGEEPC